MVEGFQPPLGARLRLLMHPGMISAAWIMNIVTAFFLLLASLISTGGQLLFKKGSEALGGVLELGGGSVNGQSIIKKIFAILFEPHIFVALLFYFAGIFVWVKVLSRTELSSAYPVLITLTVLLTTTFSLFLFKEHLTSMKAFGILLMIAGLFLMANAGK
ncbi:MAG: EamA family transporter [Parcubacteria group bacterium]|nr:EamA family transporter [Parcubacteria group bacterium]